MRILLKFEIDCDPDAAWRAVHSPNAVAELYGPLMALEPLVPSGMPTSWEPGDDVPVGMSALGIVVDADFREDHKASIKRFTAAHFIGASQMLRVRHPRSLPRHCCCWC